MWSNLSTLTATATVMLILSRTISGTDWIDYGEPLINDDIAAAAAFHDEFLTALARDQEHEAHSPSITGYKYVSGGAGEGKQHLSPSGEIPNRPEVKTDEELSSYCSPPNPCPLGFEADDCDASPMSKFTAEYSRLYQTEQDCQCDNDHDRCYFNSILYSVSSNNAMKDVLKRGRRIRRDTNGKQKSQNATKSQPNRHSSHRGQSLRFHVAKKSPISSKY